MKTVRALVTALALCAIAGGVYYAIQAGEPEQTPRGRRGQGANAGPVAVLVEAARTADVPVFLEGVGTAKARNTVTVRPQVDGRILSINFKEGQEVKKGDLLAKIDPVTYQAQLDQALAKKALDEALVANTRRDLARFEKVGTLAVSQQQIDTQRALVAQQEAQIRSDAAAIENLTAILGYTNIVAPIDGRTGIRQVDEGNLVRAGDSAGIVVITEIKPISVLFTLPQQQLPQLHSATSSGTLKAEAYTTDSHKLLDTGTLQVVDNQVDPTTGTVRLKADFPNETYQLWPGQFVNVRLLVDTLKDVVVAPSAAIQRGPNGPYVYVVKPDDTVTMRPVKVTRQDEKQAVLAEGVSAGDKVVTSGFGRLEDGAKVTVSDGTAPAQPAPVSGAPEAKGPTKAAEAENASGQNNAAPTVQAPAESGADKSSGGRRGEGKGKGRRGREPASGTTP